MTYTELKDKIDSTFLSTGLNLITRPDINEILTDILDFSNVGTREIVVADLSERDALDIEQLPTNVFVTDDGDSGWALYKATSTGTGATYVKLSDPDLLNAMMSASAIKTAYESNADTNAFTDALESKLNGVATSATANDTDANLKNRANHTGTQAISTITGLQTALDDEPTARDAAIADAIDALKASVPTDGDTLLKLYDLIASHTIKGAFGVTVDGAGGTIVAGDAGVITIPYSGTITGWSLLADTAGSCVINVLKDSYSNYPPTVGDSIAGTEKPTLTAQAKNEDLTLTTWTTSVAAGDIIKFSIESSTLVTKLYLTIFINKTS